MCATYSPLTTFIDRLDSGRIPSSVLGWGCPVPSFGDVTTARVATVGINPSNREFLAKDGVVLEGEDQRLPTLKSMGLSRWSEASSLQIREIAQSCRTYFERKPYTTWFGALDRILALSGCSYYGTEPAACHLDLIPYATRNKWGSMRAKDQALLFNSSSDSLGLLVRESSISCLVLNGQAVVRRFEHLAAGRLQSRVMNGWALHQSASSVRGIAYTGRVDQLGGIHFSTPVNVIGYNHNLQSSFGVTREVAAQIGTWVARLVDGNQQ